MLAEYSYIELARKRMVAINGNIILLIVEMNEATTRPEHPEGPRQARPQAPIRLGVKS